MESDHEVANTPPQTQYELMRDAGFKHLEYIELDDHRATEKLKRRPEKVGDNVAAESGIIESITCYNFMCHERLHVELGPLINFIVGENGSGKSAVLTALTLCLGGKASDTNRGGSLKSFVKEGQEHGKLVVKIKNAGSDAYQPDVYGDSIIVERHFSKTGSSGFKIKSADNRTISTKKQEIDEISEWYALHMGNPLTVLSQDNARQFLNSATPAQKYKYFVSGVQLEQLDNDYKMSQDTLDKTLVLRDDLNETIAHVKKEMEDAERLADIARKNESLREKARLYRHQLVWLQVVEQERALEELIEDYNARGQRILDLEKECESIGAALDEATAKLERAKSARQELNSEQESMQATIDSVEANWSMAKRKLTELHREERDAHTRLKTIRNDIRSCEKKIQDEEKRLGESTGSVRADKNAELTATAAKERELNERIAVFGRQQPSLQNNIKEAEEALQQTQKLREEKRKDILVAQDGVKESEGSTGSAFSGFDREITNLVKTIEGDQGFQDKPVGPIGAHVKLLKPEWSGLLEKTFGEALNAFVVRSKQDQSRLSAMMRRAGLKKPPPIYIAYGGRLDTKNQEPSEEFDTILRVLEFDDDLLRSQLIINSQIEKVILVDERVKAQQIMIDGGPPKNVGACICFHDGKGKRGQGLRITNRAGNISTAPIVPTGQRPRMQADSGRQLAIQKENVKQLALELRELNSEERQAQQAVQRCKAALTSYNTSYDELKSDLRRTQADLEKVQAELDGFEGVDGRLISLRAELEGKRAEEEQVGNQYGNMMLEKTGLSTKAEEAKKALETAREENNSFQERVSKADIKIRKTEDMRRVALTQKNAAYEKVDIERDERRRAESRRENKAAEVEDFIRQARDVAPDRVHIPEGETYLSIEKKYDRIGEQLRQRETRMGATDEQIFDRAKEATAKYRQVEQQTEDVDMTITSLKRAIKMRLELWRRFQRQISARVRIQFNYLLSERGFRGKINLDHKNRKVVIHIEPDETRKSSSGRDTKTLSGGEKSFSSICMLLAVWEAIGSPIRCLDEFDVFMDNVNRAISTNMLVSHSCFNLTSLQFTHYDSNKGRYRPQIGSKAIYSHYTECH